ncbi:hypothetical protein Tco_0001194 [Tanacetum coccineum]
MCVLVMHVHLMAILLIAGYYISNSLVGLLYGDHESVNSNMGKSRPRLSCSSSCGALPNIEGWRGKSSSLSRRQERIPKKKTKNKAKTTKPDTEWKSVEKTQSSPSPSVEKSTQAPPAVVEPFNLEDPFENPPPPPPPPMDDQRTMAQLLEAPTEG